MLGFILFHGDEYIMPIFEYTCDQCEAEFERLVFSGEEEEIHCPKCNSREVVKKMSATSFMGTSIGTCSTPFPKGAS